MPNAEKHNIDFTSKKIFLQETSYEIIKNSHSHLDFTPAAQTINPIKKPLNMVPKSCVKNGMIASNNTTKQPDDMGQLVT